MPENNSSMSSSRSILAIIIPIVVIVFIIFGMIAALNYMGLIPVSKVPGLGWLPSSESVVDQQGGVNNDTTEIVNTGNTIKVSSEVPGYALAINDEDGLRELIDEIGIFGNNFQDNFGGSTKGVPVKMIKIVLTDEEMPEHKFRNDILGEVYLSSRKTVLPGEITIEVYLHESVLNDPSQEESLGDYLRTGFVMGIYNIAHRPLKSGDSTLIRKEAEELLIRLVEEEKEFFSVRRL